MRDEDVWAPPAAGSPADPYAAFPRYPHDVFLLPDAPGQARAAVLSAWLERRFPDGGTAEERDRRRRRKLRVFTVLCGLVLVAVAIGLVRYGLPDSPPMARQPGWLWVFGFLLVALAGLGVALVLATRSRPTVYTAEREVLARLTFAEHRDLRADLRSPPSTDADHLDVVAAAWLARRGEVLMDAWRVLFALWFATQWQLNPLTPVALLAALWAGWDVVDGVRDLLAARAWLAARRGPGRRV